MKPSTKIAIRNANGLLQHNNEVKVFLVDKNIDIMLISETHFTDRSFLKIPNYYMYNTNHPSGKARGRTAVLIRRNIAHEVQESYQKPFLQATTISVGDSKGGLKIASVYCPPNQTLKQHQYEDFFRSLGSRFIAAGDYNAKHPHWGSRLITPRGRELLKSMQAQNLCHISTGEPTYWPTDRNKLPDVIDFCVSKGVTKSSTMIETCLDLSSDHSPLILTLNTNINTRSRVAQLHNKSTNWDFFRYLVNENLPLNIPIKSGCEIDAAVELFNHTIQSAAWSSTKFNSAPNQTRLSDAIQSQLAEKRRLRRIWQFTRNPADKKRLNKAVRSLKYALWETKNEEVQKYIANLSPTQASDYSLWKATKNLRQPTAHVPPLKTANNEWARTDKDKALTFADHLESVFKPFPSTYTNNDDTVNEFIEVPYQMEFPIPYFKLREVRWIIKKRIAVKKAPGYDLITPKILQELPENGYKFITQLYNAIIRKEYFPQQWKVAQITLIPKPGKPPEAVNSYRPISLLPILSKLFEKLLLHHLSPIIERRKLIPNHQFGFRKQHSTVEQVNRVYKYARVGLENKEYCTAAFIDITQAFDKVWHPGLLYKLKTYLPHHYFAVLKSYLKDRHFTVKVNDFVTDLHPIKAGVPQGSVLGPVLYTLYTSDLPLSDKTYTATFADDTVIMARNYDPNVASYQLQENLRKINSWLDVWRIKANESKSVQITFTLRQGQCPPVTLNNCQLPQRDVAKYLGIYLDKRLTWRHHIFTKRKQLGLRLRSLYWVLGNKSIMDIANKVLIYKVIIKPIWTYGIQIWGTASKSNLDILQRFQSKILRMCVNAPWYVNNEIIHRDLQICTIHEEINKVSIKYRERLHNHPNHLASELLNDDNYTRRLKRHMPAELVTRFKQ